MDKKAKKVKPAKPVKVAKVKKAEKAAVEPKKVCDYLCPACTNVAIQTSNKMLGVKVNCQACGKLIDLDDEKRYVKVKSK